MFAGSVSSEGKGYEGEGCKQKKISTGLLGDPLKRQKKKKKGADWKLTGN